MFPLKDFEGIVLSINISELTNLDNNTELIHSSESNINILGITDKSLLKNKHFLFIKNEKFFKSVEESLKSQKNLALIIDKQFYYDSFPKELKNTFLLEAVSEKIDLTICKLSKIFHERRIAQYNDQVDARQMGTCEIHPTALISQGVFIGENVKIGKNVKILPGVFIGANSEIGENSEVFSNAVVYHDVKIGSNCRIHANAVIGTDGYGYNFEGGIHHKIYHLGDVIIENDVEIGAGTCIDRGTFSSTRIGQGSRLDNLVHVAHNVQLGKGVLLCAGVAIAGSSIIGDYCVFGGMAGMADNCSLGKGCQIAGGAKVTGHWPDGSVLGGHPARPLKEWLKGVALLRKLTKKK